MAKDKERDKKSKRRKEKKSKSKHKSHKHKKHKADKNEERASVSSSSHSSSSSDAASHSSSSQADESQLASLLSQACVQFPQLIEEFPALLQALDADQGIQLNQLENAAIRSVLEEIFLHLPLELVEEDGTTEFYKSSAVDSLSNWLSAHLLARNFVATPETMSTSQLLATQGAIQVQQLLKEFPEIRDDMITVLETIHQGSFVQIESLENERVKELLAELFQALSLDYQPPQSVDEHDQETTDKADVTGDTSAETGYGLKNMEGAASQALEYVLRSLAIARESQSNDAPSVPEVVDDAESSQKLAVVGPAMPTREQLAEAQAAAASYMQKYHMGPEAEEEDDEEDDFGPSMATPAQKAAAQKAAAASNDAGPELLGMIGAAMPSIESSATTALQPIATPAPGHGHEEWMMTPGDSKLLGGLKSTLPTTRTFQRGKLAKAAEEERKRKMPQVSEEEQKQMDEALAAHRAKRGKSLVELHQEQRREQAARGIAKPKERRAFDREKDLGTRQMDEARVRQLVAKAKDFDSRFSKSVQRTFL